MLCGTMAALFMRSSTCPAFAMALTAVKASAPVGSASISSVPVLGLTGFFETFGLPAWASAALVLAGLARDRAT